jgi:predicted dehydrogenase
MYVGKHDMYPPATDLFALGYTVSCIRYLMDSNPTSVVSAKPNMFRTKDGIKDNIDVGMSATFTFPADATGSIYCCLREPPRFGIIPILPGIDFTVQCENGELKMYNFGFPTLYHYLEISTKTGPGGKERKKRLEKVYTSTKPGVKGEAWWST